MNICVLNFSPKGINSITLQYVRFIAKHFTDDKFSIINIGEKICNKELVDNYEIIINQINKCEVLLFSYPVYNCLPPSTLFDFFENLNKQQLAVFNNKSIVQITSSKHSFDNIAHEYVELLCNDLGMKTCKGFSADLDSLMDKSGQIDVLNYWKYVHMLYENDCFEKKIQIENSPVLKYRKSGKKVTEKAADKTVVILTDRDIYEEEKLNSSLFNMVDEFVNMLPYTVKIINLNRYISGGCRGCLACCLEGKCAQDDIFRNMHEGIIKQADALIFAGEIKNHYLGSIFKKYDEREYYNGNRDLGNVKAIGYIVSGNYEHESMLNALFNARAEQHYTTFLGVATDESDTFHKLTILCSKLVYCIENQYVQPGGFYKTAKINAFKDLISDMRGIMKKDYLFFKENKYFYNAIRTTKKIVGMSVIGKMIKAPILGAKIMEGFSEATSASQKRIVEKESCNSFINPYNKKRVLLIAPELKTFTDAPPLPIGLLSIGTYLSNKEYTVKIINRTEDRKNIKKIIEDFKPDIAGVSVISTQTLKDGIDISKSLKKEGVAVVWGGPLASAIPEIVLKEDFVDFVIVGEGEKTWEELLEKLEDKNYEQIRGLAFKNNQNIVKNEERNPMPAAELPIINYNLININKYTISHFDCKNMIWVCAGKGCPNNCTFCYNKSFNKCKYRKRPIEDILAEIRSLSENSGIDGVSFSDELWCIDAKEMHNICDKIKDSEINFVWGCFLRIDSWKEEDFKYMYDAGCRWILFGIESGSEKILRKINKGIDISKVEETVKNCYNAGIFPWASFIIGIPGETVEDLKKTVKLGKSLLKYRCRISFNFFTPVIGSDLYNELVLMKKVKYPNALSDLFDDAWNILSNNYSDIPLRDLKVISSVGVFWSAASHFFNKENKKENVIFYVFKTLEVLVKNYKKYGFFMFFNWIISMATTFIPSYFRYKFSVRIKKKYGI